MRNHTYHFTFNVDSLTETIFIFLSQMITRENFEDTLKELQDEGLIVVMGKTSIRVVRNRD